jgi:hypothetical protein
LADFLLEGRQLAMPRKGLISLLLELERPGPEQRLTDAKRTGGFGNRVSFLRDQLDRLELELPAVNATLSRHDEPPTVIIHR